MAKVKAVEAKEESSEQPKVYIDLATSEEDVVAYDAAGVHLIFNKKRFRKLSRESFEALSHDNQKRYLKAKAELEEEAEAKKPLPRLQVIDPLGGHEGALLNVKITDPLWAKKWHVCWQYAEQADIVSRAGYSKVIAGEDPIECGLKPAGTTFVMKDPRARADLDLMLMKIPMHIFLQHQNAVAQKSTDKLKGYRDQFAEEVAEGSDGKLRGAKLEQEPDEKVTLKRSDLRPV
jgi:hypothetical protein